MKRWETVRATLRYVRDASTTGAFSGEVRDVVSFGLLWDPHPRWHLGFNASWENREQTQDAVVPAQTLTPTTVLLFSPELGLFQSMDIGAATGLRTVLQNVDVKDRRYIVSLFGEYRVTKRLSVFSNAYWIRQDTEAATLLDRQIDRVNVRRRRAFLLRSDPASDLIGGATPAPVPETPNMNASPGFQLGDVVGILRRRAALAGSVALAIFLLAVVAAAILPNRYEAWTTLLIEPQSISAKLVAAGVGESDINNRLHLHDRCRS